MKATLYVICVLILSALFFAPRPDDKTKEGADPPETVPELVDSAAKIQPPPVEMDTAFLARKADSYQQKYDANLRYLKHRAPQIDSILKDSSQ